MVPFAMAGTGITSKGQPSYDEAVAAASDRTPIVRRACSTNFFVRGDGGWTADTTDPEGVMLALKDHGVKPGQYGSFAGAIRSLHLALEIDPPSDGAVKKMLHDLRQR